VHLYRTIARMPVALNPTLPNSRGKIVRLFSLIRLFRSYNLRCLLLFDVDNKGNPLLGIVHTTEQPPLPPPATAFRCEL
jgi:hypothetical protein